MNKKRDLLYKNNISQNINLFKENISDNAYADLNNSYKKHLVHFKNSDTHNFTSPKAKQFLYCNHTTHQDYENYKKNFVYKKPEVHQAKQNQTTEIRNRQPSLQKNTHSGSKKSHNSLSIREEDNTPTFSLIEDPSQPKDKNLHSFKPFNSLELPRRYEEQSRNEGYKKKFKHYRHHSDGLNSNIPYKKYERSFSKNEKMFTEKQTLNKGNEQSTGQSRVQSKVLSELQARLQNELKKNQDLSLKCRQLLNTNKRLKETKPEQPTYQSSLRSYKAPSQLDKWRNILNCKDTSRLQQQNSKRTFEL